MNSQRPFLDIPRLPHERKLRGVPHAKKESVFAEPGVPDALSLANGTYGLNSKQRRAILDATLPRLQDRLGDVAHGLDVVSDVSVNPERSRHAGYLAQKVLDRISTVPTISIDGEALPAEDDSVALPGFLRYTDDVYERIEASLEDDNYNPNAQLQNLAKDKEVTGSIREQIVLDDEADPRIVELGVKLFRRYNHTDDTFDSMVARYILFTKNVDNVKKAVSGKTGPTAITNQITAAYAAALADQVGPSCERVAQLDSLEQHFLGDDKTLDWYRIKIDVLRDYFVKSHQVDHYIQRYESSFTQRLSEKMFSLAGVERKREIADETMSLLIELRRYGIKPAYFDNDVLTKRPEESWVFYDMRSIDKPENLPQASPTLATIALAASSNPEDLSMRKEETENKVAKYMTKFGGRMMLGMHANGELSVGGMANPFTLRKMFEERGHEGLYEQLRLNLIRNLFDLVAPASLVLPRNQNGRIKKLFGGSKELVETGELLLGRVRYAQNNIDEVIAELDAEHAIERRITIGHDVVAHVRVLPPGYCPSPDARAEALKHGIVLAPNETFVKKHSRGSTELGTIRSHQATSVHPVD